MKKTGKTKSYKEVPTFEGNYQQFEREVKLWSGVTTLKKAEQGAALALSLTGAARTIATNLPEADITGEDGLTKVLAAIKGLYARDTIDAQFTAMTEFEAVERDPDQKVGDYLLDFDLKYNTAKDICGADLLSEPMKAFRLISRANLSETDSRIARVGMTEWKYDTAIKVLKNTFGEGSLSGSVHSLSSASSVSTPMTHIKTETVNYNKGGSNSRMSFLKKKRKCWNCQSEDHLQSECPVPKESGNNNYYKKKNFFHKFKSEKKDRVNFVHPENIHYAENHALLDSGASRNIAGRKWTNYFRESLDKETRNEIVEYTEKRPFMFGENEHIGTKATLPLTINGTTYPVEVYIVDIDVPLLLSTITMRELNIILDFAKQKAEINGSVIDLILTPSNHLLVPVVEDKIFYGTDVSFSPGRLHRAFGHATADRIMDTLSKCEIKDNKLKAKLKELDANCEFCQRHRRNATKPNVTVNLSENFNDLVCIDLKFLKEEDGSVTILLHLIDHLTKFSMAKVIRDKSGTTIVEGMLATWISVFGPPKRILSDNGKEFTNIHFSEMCDLLNIKHDTTASYAPFANGVVERHNGILATMVRKLREDLKVSTETALSWALQAKNSLLNNKGFSPSQLVFGANPNVPQVSTNKEGGLRDRTPSSVMNEMLNTLHRAREEYIKAESSSKLKRALKCKVENSECTMFKTGDKVLFRRRIDNQWIGPVDVIGQLGKTVVVLHSGQTIKVHFTQVRAYGAPCAVTANEEPANGTSTSDPHRPVAVEPSQDEDDYASSESSDCETRPVVSELTGQRPVVSELTGQRPVVSELTGQRPVVSELTGQRPVVSELTGQRPEVTETSEVEQEVTVPETQSDQQSSSCWENIATQGNKMIVKVGDQIRYKEDENDNFVEAVVTSKAGKSSGALKNRFNVRDSTSKEYRVDLNKVHSAEIMVQNEEAERSSGVTSGGDGTNFQSADQSEPVGSVFVSEDCIWAVMVPKSRFKEPDIAEAMETELKSLQSFGAYEEVKDLGQATLSMRWIITEKSLSGGKTAYKGRLVCRGFEEEESQFEVDSPTVEKSSVRTFLALSSLNKWRTHSVDIKSAFLQADMLDRDVHVRPPKNIKKAGVIWKLLKPLYGLSDSSRNWYFTLTKTLKELGLEQSSYDKALFYIRSVNKLEGVLVVHVDDLLFSGNKKFLAIVKRLCDIFKISKSESGCCKYIGLDISESDDGLVLTQDNYCELIQSIPVHAARKNELDSPLSKEELTQYQSLLGKLNWLSCNTRPDLKFDVFYFSQYNKHPLIKHLNELNSVAKRVHKSQVNILFPRLDIKKLRMLVYSDASLGNLDDKLKSCKAYIVFLADDTRACPLTWNCKKIDRVCSDTLEAETRAMKFGVIHGIALNSFLSELLGFKVPVHSKIDSKTLEKAVFSTKNVSDPILKRDVGRIQQLIQKGEITRVDHVRSADQLADVMTKKGVNPIKIQSILESGRI